VLVGLQSYVSCVKSCRREDKQADKTQQVKKSQYGVVLRDKILFRDLPQIGDITSKYQKEKIITSIVESGEGVNG